MTTKLKITQYGKSKIIELSPQSSLKIPTQPNTKYELLDENNQIIAEPKAVIKGMDVEIYKGKTDAIPDVILENYKSYVPVFSENTVETAVFQTCFCLLNF